MDTQIIDYTTGPAEYVLQVGLPAPDRISVSMWRCADCDFEVADGEYAAAAIEAHVAENDGHRIALGAGDLVANPDAGKLTDEQGRPFNLRVFTWPRDDERWADKSDDEIAAEQRAEVRAQLEREASPEPVVSESTTTTMPGVGEPL